jgi:hypothetical protein
VDPSRKNVRAVHAQPGAFLAKPGGYTLVTSVPVTAAALGQTFATLTCPIKKGVQTVPLDGGAEIVSSSLAANINSSYPSSDGKSWDVYVNNGTGSSTTFNVYAVCAKKLKNYVQRSSILEPNPANTQSGYFFVCPPGDVIIGGGALSTSGTTVVNLGSDFPSGQNSWEIYVNNASGVDASVTVYQICAKNTSKLLFVIQSTPGLLDAAGTEQSETQFCPSGWSVLGGGVQSNTGLTSVNINSTFPGVGAWRVFENNASGFNVNLTVYADCGT